MIRTSLFLSTALLLTACGGSAPESAPEASEANASAASEARKVTTLEAAPAPFDHFFTVQGNVETDRLAQVFPMTQGTVLRIRVNEGARPSEKGRSCWNLTTTQSPVTKTNWTPA